MRFRAIAVTGIFVFLTACSSLTHSKNDEVVSKVKKIAVVGFTVDAPAPATIGLSLNSGKVEGHHGGSMITKQDDSMTEMYQVLCKSFGENMKWQVIPFAQLKQNKAYLTAYDKTMKGWQNKMPAGQGRQQYVVDGLMDDDGLRILGQEGRSELIKGLGVDAVVTARVSVELKGTAIMGIGSRYPQSRASFKLFTSDKSTPDWFEGNLAGEESKTPVGKTAFFDEKLMRKLALESARTAFAQIGKP